MTELSTESDGVCEPVRKRAIVYMASRDALGPMTDRILSRLGYQMVPPETFAALRGENPELEAELLVVDERRLDEVGSGLEGIDDNLPIVLLTGQRGVIGSNPRIFGAVKRPAGLHDLYQLMQQLFEDTPRATPRVATQIRARCRARGSEWEGRVVSLSENGCLLRSGEDIPLGRTLMLELMLPSGPALDLVAEAAYQLLPDTGLVFSAVEPSSREALGNFVARAISA